MTKEDIRDIFYFMKRLPSHTRVFVMMSGGVDSSVAAALLKQRGFLVTGIFMKNWGKEGKGCTYVQDEQDARRVAGKLYIPFYVLNFEKEYYERVFTPFIEGIKQGITPNPDVYCNQEIKFGIFLQKALELGADMVATGHYARVAHKGRHILLRAKDNAKDQTYFLYRLTQSQLSRTLFPIGDYEKREVRSLAKKFGLPTATKPDSQGICFVGESPFDEFLRDFVESHVGNIVDEAGKFLGQHKGVPFYTIGQRKGLGIGGQASPRFVARKDPPTNTLVVVPEGHNMLYNRRLYAVQLSWVVNKPAVRSFSCQVRFRHQQPLQRATITLQHNGALVEFTKEQRAITPGQSVVFYKGRRVLGGGIISL